MVTPKQEKLVDDFFEDVAVPASSGPVYLGVSTIKALEAMWKEHKLLREKAGDTPGAIGNLKWMKIGKVIRPLTEPQPDYQEDVPEYIDRVGPPVMAALKVEMPKYLPSRGAQWYEENPSSEDRQ